MASPLRGHGGAGLDSARLGTGVLAAGEAALPGSAGGAQRGRGTLSIAVGSGGWGGGEGGERGFPAETLRGSNAATRLCGLCGLSPSSRRSAAGRGRCRGCGPGSRRSQDALTWPTSYR